jgi:hypothetical protein
LIVLRSAIDEAARLYLFPVTFSYLPVFHCDAVELRIVRISRKLAPDYPKTRRK